MVIVPSLPGRCVVSSQLRRPCYVRSHAHAVGLGSRPTTRCLTLSHGPTRKNAAATGQASGLRVLFFKPSTARRANGHTCLIQTSNPRTQAPEHSGGVLTRPDVPPPRRHLPSVHHALGVTFSLNVLCSSKVGRRRISRTRPRKRVPHRLRAREVALAS